MLAGTVSFSFLMSSAGLLLVVCSCLVHQCESASVAALLMEPRPYPYTLMAIRLNLLSSSSDRWILSSANVPFSPGPLGDMVEKGVVTGWLTGGLLYWLMGWWAIGSFEDV